MTEGYIQGAKPFQQDGQIGASCDDEVHSEGTAEVLKQEKLWFDKFPMCLRFIVSNMHCGEQVI